MTDVLIVGAGAAGVAAALRFSERGLKPLIVDVGNLPDSVEPRINRNFYEHRKQHDTFQLMIGSRFDGLSNLIGERSVPVKLNSPFVEYVTRDAERIGPIQETNFGAVQSYAQGGLANAWGAGMYRYRNEDLKEFPIREEDLAPYYRRLELEMGISGTNDDLTPFFGREDSLLPPIRLSTKIRKIYSNYQRKKKKLTGLHMGRARLAVLTREKDGRPPCAYDSFEFWQSSPWIYSPRMTLKPLIETGKVAYRRGVVVKSWAEHGSDVVVEGVELEGVRKVHMRANKLILAAGCLNTSRIVLESLRAYERKLRLLDTHALQVPLVLPGSIGSPLETTAFGLTQLNLFWESQAYDSPLFGSILEITSPARAEFLGSLPYTARFNLSLIKYLLPAMLVMQLFFPPSAVGPAALFLKRNGHLGIEGRKNTLDVATIRGLIGCLRKIGAITHPSLIVRVKMGHGLHYAGTVPMRVTPGPYECDSTGRLFGTRNVFVADAASFPSATAKNTSFTMMANAMRIADQVVNDVRGHG